MMPALKHPCTRQNGIFALFYKILGIIELLRQQYWIAPQAKFLATPLLCLQSSSNSSKFPTGLAWTNISNSKLSSLFNLNLKFVTTSNLLWQMFVSQRVLFLRVGEKLFLKSFFWIGTWESSVGVALLSFFLLFYQQGVSLKITFLRNRLVIKKNS